LKAIAALLTGAALSSVASAQIDAAPQEEQAERLPSPPAIHWRPDAKSPGRAVVEVSGLTEAARHLLEQTNWTVREWQRVLSVYAEESNSRHEDGSVAMAGAYRVGSNGPQFIPAFPLEPGLSYRAVFRPAALTGIFAASEEVTAVYTLAGPIRRAATRVTEVYPTAAALPENLLKFYLHFSEPMSRGHVYDYIHLRTETGTNVELPFLELDEELWDPTMTRLTLFLDPGRIKRGVRPLEEVGPSLERGHRYTLVISRALRDAVGHSLAEDFEKPFLVTPPDREPLDPTTWKIEPPQTGTRGALAIRFPKPLDHALAQRSIRVIDPAGATVFGVVGLSEGECRWSFVPGQPWPSGTYQLAILTTIEDLAGNNIGKPFEVDLFENVSPRLTNSIEKLRFSVR
jgi:hypothetical protein